MPGQRTIVPLEWMQGRDTPAIARGLLGLFLVHRTVDGDQAAMITEVEAYQGEEDLACHARHGRTPRNAVMYGPGGYWYVFLCYGVHEMLNLVTGPEGYPAAVLIRGLEGAVGPGRLTKKYGINRTYQGKPSTPETGLWLENRGAVIDPKTVVVGPRIGIDYAGAHWAGMPWRFHLPTPSRRKRPLTRDNVG